MTYDEIARANAAIQTTNIKGKEYAEVNQRIKAFRMVYPTGGIMTDMLSNENGVCVFRATVGYFAEDGEYRILGTGTAYEKESSSYINKTSYIENCETSAVGRALGMAGFGIDTSVASYEEVQNAINNQGKKSDAVVYEKPTDAVICPNCGKPVMREYSKKNGKWLTPEEVLEQCGGVCLPCYRENKS